MLLVLAVGDDQGDRLVSEVDVFPMNGSGVQEPQTGEQDKPVHVPTDGGLTFPRKSGRSQLLGRMPGGGAGSVLSDGGGLIVG